VRPKPEFEFTLTEFVVIDNIPLGAWIANGDASTHNNISVDGSGRNECYGSAN